jgi:F-type H+-transporting ATPase subunit b
MPQFDFSTYSSQIFWLLVVFAFIYIVAKFTFPVIGKLKQDREELVQGYINEVQILSKKVQELEELYQKELQEISAGVAQMQQNSVENINQRKIDQLKDVELKIKEQLKLAQNEIDSAVLQFESTKKEALFLLASCIIEKLTNKVADKQLLETAYQNIT